MPELIIFGQVQLSRIIMPNDDDDTDQGFWFNRICRMSVDYVLVDQDKQTVLLAIELDDWTHNTRRRQQQDEKRQSAVERRHFDITNRWGSHAGCGAFTPQNLSGDRLRLKSQKTVESVAFKKTRYNTQTQHRRLVQLVERRSPKPNVGGSSPSSPATF